MIIEDINLNLYLNDKLYENQSITEAYNLLEGFLMIKSDMSSGEIFSPGDNYHMTFCDDPDQNKFFIKIYKTLYGSD